MDHLYARRTVPPPGEGSSSSAAGSSCHIRPLPPPPPCGWWQQRGPQWESPHTLTASKLLELLHEMGRLSHPASSCLSVFICFRNDSVFVTSIVWPKQLEQKTLGLPPTATTMPPDQDQYEVSLDLVTIAGTEYAMQTNLAQYENVAELEDDILCFLPTVSDLDVFGWTCSTFTRSNPAR